MKERVRDLTPRHREVVRLLSLGCSVPEIAAVLDIAPNTVDNHRNEAMYRLGVSKAALVTRVAIKHRISRIDDQLTRGEKRKLARNA